jgi:hypothetical protein
MRPGVVFVLVALAAGGAAQAQQHGSAHGADGVWTFEASTSSGSCPGIEPRDVTIESGHVVAANGGASQPWGYVEGDGTFVARFTDAGGAHISRVVGSLHGDSGKGAWSSSTDLCGGNWRASRSGSRATR